MLKEKQTMLAKFGGQKNTKETPVEPDTEQEQPSKWLTHICELALTNQVITIEQDGNQWCALLGPDLQEGVAGFGDTPKEALLQLCESL